MWTKNGQSTLPAVLKQIERVIPKEAVNKKIMVDDQSTDNTKQIGLDHGWTVIPNEDHGISAGANTALKHVEMPTFCSFEQDLFLSNEWFNKVYPLIHKENVAVASGVRFPTGPSAVKNMEILGHKDYLSKLSRGVTKKSMHGQTFDNTAYRTNVIRSLGGFDYIKSNAGQDCSLSLKVMKTKKYVWEVNYDVISLHLRPNNYMNELRHQRWYAGAFREIYSSNKVPLPSVMTTKAFMYRFVKSPLTSVKLLRRTRDPLLFYYYPAFCFAQLIGLVEGKRYEHKLQ